MKFTTTIVPSCCVALVLSVGKVAAFTAPQQQRAFRTSMTSLCAESSSSSASATRGQFLSQVATTTAAAFLATSAPAQAAKYGGLGAGSPEVIDPSEAVVDLDILKSDSVQKSLANLQGYLERVKFMQAAMEKNDQTDLGGYLEKEFDFVALRGDLNTVNTAFEEDTQRGTDRLIRGIIQDITELETANRQPEGVPRSPKRYEIVKAKLSKLNKAFSDYLAFAK